MYRVTAVGVAVGVVGSRTHGAAGAVKHHSRIEKLGWQLLLRLLFCATSSVLITPTIECRVIDTLLFFHLLLVDGICIVLLFFIRMSSIVVRIFVRGVIVTVMIMMLRLGIMLLVVILFRC